MAPFPLVAFSFFTALEKGNWGQAATKAMLHGISRSAITKLQGGRWSSGFWSGFASSFFSPGTKLGGEGTEGMTLRTVIAGTIGGTVSEITGGKFANGAVTGAFVHLFNAKMNKLLKDWLVGNGPKVRVYGPNSEMTKELMTDPVIKFFKNKFLNSYNTIGSKDYYPVKFGVTDFFVANTSTLANIGSYGLSIYYTGSNELTFVISNTMGFKSLTGGLFPNIDSGPMSSIETWFWWKETVK